MKSVVVYASRSGNTRTVAQAISGVLGRHGPTQLVAAEDASATVWVGAGLLVVGGPTESRHATPPIRAFFDRLPAHALRGIVAAAFDTRLAWPRLLGGSAAEDLSKLLRSSGAMLVAPNESFIVSMEPMLEPGEIERAMEWARDLAHIVEPAGMEPADVEPAPVLAGRV